MSDSLITADRITKSFAGVQALSGVSFDVRAHEVHALVGENGAGKSTLIRILTGAEMPDQGTLIVGGRAVHHLDPSTARRLGIAAVYQQPALFPHLTVAENLAVGSESPRGFRRVSWTARRQRAHELLARMGSRLDPDRLVESLSLPEQQIVEIAKAVGAEARVLILDEPTASLTAGEVTLLLDVLRRLKDDGVGIVYISHRLDEVMAIADRITVLRDGRSVGTDSRGALSVRDLIQRMVGDELEDPPARFPRSYPDAGLEVRHLSSQSAAIWDVSLTIGRGEILGLAGLVGSGRTELAETLFGLAPVDEGQVLVAGARVVIESPQDAIRCGLAYVPEDRRRHGVVLDMSVAANMTMASLDSVTSRGMVDVGKESQLAERFVSRLQIKTPSSDANVGSLSGGNQQKVAIARWLATSPVVLMLDEPTQGIDVRAKGEVHRLVRELAADGMAVLLISSDVSELLMMSDRIAVMRDGTIVDVMPRASASRDSVLRAAFGSSGASA